MYIFIYVYIYLIYISVFFSHQTQLIESVDESQDTPDNQDASVEEAPQVEALEEEIERAPGGRNEEGTEVLDVANAEPVHVATPDHANKNQEVDEVPNIDAPPISIHDSHNYRRPTRSGRVPRYTDRYVEYMESFGNAASTDPAPKRSSFFELEVDEPQTYKQAVESRYAEQWLPAFKAEYDSQIKNKSWVLIPKSHVPTECAILPHKWVGKYKPGYGDPLQPDFVAPRFKGRLTVVGCHQQYGVDYEETYAPVPRLDSIRSVLSLTASLGYKSFQFDVATAFLNADVDKPIFMTQPEGFVVSGKEDHVCKLLKAVYGIKQAPRLWCKTFIAALLRYGFKALDADMCVFILVNNSIVSHLFIWVDDGWFSSSSDEECQRFATWIGNEFEVRCLPPTRFVGMNIEYDRENSQVFLSQQHSILKALEQFGMTDSHPKLTPAESSVHLSSSMVPRNEGKVDMSLIPYRAAVGFLLYLSSTTRPDIAYGVGQVSKFCENPQPAHWNAVKRIFAYLKGTLDFGIWLGGRKDEGAVVYTDADYASDVDDRKSISGCIAFYKGGPVAWK